jgi:hypothetical protein
MDPSIALTELMREIASIIMLLSVSIISGEKLRQRFAFFIYCFGVWDIFYYVFMYLLIGWPASLMTWDILFLIPVSWIGPVISPLIVSFTMIVLALLILIKDAKNQKFNINFYTASFFTAGTLLIILAFIWDYSSYMLKFYTVKELFSLLGNRDIYETASNYIPRHFNWFLFLFGEFLIVLGTILSCYHKKSSEQ